MQPSEKNMITEVGSGVFDHFNVIIVDLHNSARISVDFCCHWMFLDHLLLVVSSYCLQMCAGVF